MEHLLFTKMSGAGNDFIVIDCNLNPYFVPDTLKTKAMCNRRTGIGADGLLFITDPDGYDFGLEYFNADGSTGALCGNGARCAIWYAEKSARLKTNIARFTSSVGNFSGQVLGNELILLKLSTPRDLKPKRNIEADDITVAMASINTGAPHAVIDISEISGTVYWNDIDNLPVYSIGRQIRNHHEFGTEGTNVNFIQTDGDILKIRTYERGVEDETLACGTGSVASALIAFMDKKVEPPVKLLTRSGDYLTVNFNLAGNNISEITLTGPAKVVFTGEISI